MNRAEKLNPPATKLRSFEHSLPMVLLKAREAAMTRFRPMLREHGLTEQQWRVLRVLNAYSSIDAGELASRSLLLAPSLTRILQFLDTEKLVRRTVDATDQRRAVFRLTPKGERVFNAIAPESELIYAELEQAFGKARLMQLFQLLDEFSQL